VTVSVAAEEKESGAAEGRRKRMGAAPMCLQLGVLASEE
jgi:hypothetical protein